MIRGWFTEIPSWRGRVGIRIRESGLTAPISRSESASASAGTVALAGAGIIGDSIGTTGSPCSATTGIFPVATRFTTGPILDGLDSGGAGSITAATKETVAELRTAPAQPAGLSTETAKPLEDTLNPEVRAVCGRAP